MLSRNQVRAGLLKLLLVSEHICHSLRGVAIPAPTSRLSVINNVLSFLAVAINRKLLAIIWKYNDGDRHHK